VKFDDRIVVVDPASRLVVAMIPRYRLLPQSISRSDRITPSCPHLLRASTSY
jgi:hypothetical protein